MPAWDENRIGTFAEFAVVRDGAAALKPTNVTFEKEASPFASVALTACKILAGDRKAWRQPTRVDSRGERVGVGSVAIQLALSHGRNGFYHRGETQCGIGEASRRERRHRAELSERTF